MKGSKFYFCKSMIWTIYLLLCLCIGQNLRSQEVTNDCLKDYKTENEKWKKARKANDPLLYLFESDKQYRPMIDLIEGIHKNSKKATNRLMEEVLIRYPESYFNEKNLGSLMILMSNFNILCPNHRPLPFKTVINKLPLLLLKLYQKVDYTPQAAFTLLEKFVNIPSAASYEMLDVFLSLNPKPPFLVAANFASLFDNVSVSMERMKEKLLKAKIIQSPQDYLKFLKFLGNKKWELGIHDLMEFLMLSQPSTLKEVRQFSDFAHDGLLLRNTAYQQGLVQSSEGLIDLFSGTRQRINFDQATLDKFFNFNPAPTLKQIVDLANLTWDRNLVRNMAYDKGYVNNVEDFLFLYKGLGKIEFPEATLIQFFNWGPNPDQITELIEMTPYPLREKIQKLVQEMRKRSKVLVWKNYEKELNGVNANDLPQCDHRDELQQYHEQWLAMNESLNHVNKYLMARPLEDKEGRVCSVCMSGFPNSDDGHSYCFQCQREDCQYQICADCFAQDLQTKISHTDLPFHCSGVGCKKPLVLTKGDLRVIPAYKGNPKYTFFKERLTKKFHHLIFPQAQACATINCDNRLVQPEVDQDGHYTCSFCHGHYCLKCNEDHPGKSCEEHIAAKKGDDRFVADALRDPASKIRPCPHSGCHKPFSKNDECNYVDCPHCKKPCHFNEGRWNPDIHNHDWEDRPRRYRVPDDIDPKTGKPYGVYLENVDP